jgi:hypothetical protein
MTSPTLSFPPLAAIFLTHFDDIKGQSVLYYKSSDEESEFYFPEELAMIPTTDTLLAHRTGKGVELTDRNTTRDD